MPGAVGASGTRNARLPTLAVQPTGNTTQKSRKTPSMTLTFDSMTLDIYSVLAVFERNRTIHSWVFDDSTNAIICDYSQWCIVLDSTKSESEFLGSTDFQLKSLYCSPSVAES